MIIQQKKIPSHVAFSSLKEGDTFHAVESDPNVLWMKTTHIETDDEDYNAVDLSDGDMTAFDGFELVTPVKVTAVEE